MKRHLKKAVLAFFLCTAILSGFAGCGGQNGTDSSSGSDTISDSSSGSQSSPEEIEYEDYFKSLTIGEGNLLVYGRSESLSRAQEFFGESVQGLFAQNGESRYYHYRSGSYDTWLNEINMVYGKANEDVTLSEMLEDFKAEIGTGYVLFDESSSASVNCARSIAGVKQVVMIDESLKEWADSNGLEQKYDAREMTEQECFESYRDEFDNGGLVQQNGSNVQLTDYAIACKYFCYFVTDQKPASLTFRNEVQNWCSGCAVYGWCPLDEGTDVSFSSRYGSFTLASDYCYNMSVFACTEFFGLDYFEQPNQPSDISGYSTDKHYITIVNSDGDNLQCWYGGTFEADKYMGAERGDFPMGWSVSPALYSLGPNIIDHTYRNAKAGDRFVCSVSGLGYTYPMSYTAEALARYCAILDEYLGATDLSVVKILDNGLPEQTIEAYSKMENAKGFLYCTYSDSYVGEHGSVYWSENGKPFVSCRATMWNSSAEAIAEQINAYPADATTIEGYTYVNLHVWSMDYNDVKAMVELLDEDVVVVDPDTFIELITKNVPHEDVKLTA